MMNNPIMEESQIFGGLNETSEGPCEIAISFNWATSLAHISRFEFELQLSVIWVSLKLHGA